MPEVYLTVADVSERLKISAQTVWRLVRQDRLPHFRVGKLIRFDPKAIDEWIASGGKRKIRD